MIGLRRNPFDERAGLIATMSAGIAFKASPFHRFARNKTTIDHLEDVTTEVARLACELAGKAPKGRLMSIAFHWANALIDASIFTAPSGDLGRNEISRRASLYRDANGFPTWSEHHAALVAAILDDLPDWLADDEMPTGVNLEIELLGVMGSPKKALDHLQWLALESGGRCINGLHSTISSQIDRVTRKRSGRASEFDDDDAAITIAKHPSDDLHRLIDGYFASTAIPRACRMPVPITFSDTTRSRHTWVIGGSGSGKSFMMTRQMVNRLKRVAEGKAAMLVIDPKCQLVDFLLKLGCFKPGSELAKRTYLFDLGDADLTPRLTPWSLAGSDADFNQALDAFSYLVGEVGSASVSQRQKTVLGHFLRLMTVWPGATLDSLRSVLQHPDLAKPHLHKLDQRTRDFFLSVDGGGLDYVSDVTDALYWRVDGMQGFDEFNRLLNNAEANFDAADVLNGGALILIRLPQFKLSTQQQGDLGRALLSMTAGVINQRYATGNIGEAIPGDVIIDEAQMVFQGKDDTVARNVLSTARGAGWGLTIMHQNLGQLSKEMEDSIAGNCGTIIVGKCSAKDAKSHAENMGCPSDLFPNIKDEGARHFVLKSDGMIDRGTICHAPFDDFSDVGRLTEDEHAELMAGFKRRLVRTPERDRRDSHVLEVVGNVVTLPDPGIKQRAVPL